MGVLEDMMATPERGGYLDKFMDYGMRFGGQNLGVSDAMRAGYVADRDKADNLAYINANQVQGQNPGPYALGTPEMQQAMQPRFNPDLQMQLAARTGQMGQYLAGQQGMERQQQQQVWSQNNMTMGQKAELDLRQTEQSWQRERREFEWNNPNVVQQAQMQEAAARTAQGWANVAQGQQRLQQEMQPKMPAAPAGYTWTPQGTLTEIPGGAPHQAKAATTNVLQGAINTLGDIKNQVRTDGTTGLQTFSGDTQAAQQAFANAARTVISKAVMGTRTDAPNQADLDAINSQIGDITKLFGRSDTKAKVIQMLIDTANEQRPPGSAGIAYQPGQSPYFKNYRGDTGRSKLPADVVPWKGP